MKPPAPSPRPAAGLSLLLRHELLASDAEAIRAMVTATERFHPAEVEVAVELVLDRLAKGEASEYWFTVAELEGQVVGYACYGPIPCTASSYDLYWIAVDPRLQGRGIGHALVQAAESRIAQAGGTHVFIDTSSRPDYAPTRAFYEKTGYRQEAVLKDFYAADDDKAVFSKKLGRN